MNDRDTMVQAITEEFKDKPYVYAMWLEGSEPQGCADEFSDIDLWISVDDDKIFTIFDEVETALSSIGKIDFRYAVKDSGDLGQNVYHLAGMNEFLTIDVNTQGINREVYLVKGIDDVKVLFDKQHVIKFKDREPAHDDIVAKRQKLFDFYMQMKPNVTKNIHRGRKLEALFYYHLILQYTTKFLRLKYHWPEKTDFDLKHIYRDLPKTETQRLEHFYDVRAGDVEAAMEELRVWLKIL